MKGDGDQPGVKLRHLAEFLPTRILGYTLRVFPRSTRRTLGRLLGRVAFALDARHRAVTLANLDVAFGQAKTANEKSENWFAQKTSKISGSIFSLTQTSVLGHRCITSLTKVSAETPSEPRVLMPHCCGFPVQKTVLTETVRSP